MPLLQYPVLFDWKMQCIVYFVTLSSLDQSEIAPLRRKLLESLIQLMHDHLPWTSVENTCARPAVCFAVAPMPPNQSRCSAAPGR